VPSRIEEGEVTRTRLVEVAERLFAEYGIGSVSIREINRAAGAAPSAVHYHFGSKDSLLDAVLSQHNDVIETVVADADRWEADGAERPAAADIIRIMARPLVSVLLADPVRGTRWLKIMANVSWRQAQTVWPQRRELDARLLELAFPGIDEQTRNLRFAMASLSLSQILALSPAGDTPADKAARARYVDEAVRFVTEGFSGVMEVGPL
jgi:AcrR family transcriptional regulator